MTGPGCGCGTADRAAGRVRRSARWVAPAVVLAAMPKCPMCVAAYVFAATGVSVSVATAAWVRAGLIVGSVGWLACVVLLAVRRIVWRPQHRA